MSALEIGAVVRTDWDERPYRVLALDEVEALYDSWQPHKSAWGMAVLSGSASYYRVPTNLFQTRGTIVRTEPLSDAEFAVHRPDLPLRLLRDAALQWTARSFAKLDSFADFAQRQATKLNLSGDDIVLDAPRVALQPFGSSGGQKPATIIQALDGRRFSTLELLWRANNCQAPHARSSSQGIGLYRLGFANKTPSFYLWGYRDKAGFVF